MLLKPLVSPLTLDCVVRACDSNDVLKTRFRVVVLYSVFKELLPGVFRLAAKGGNATEIPTLRQESAFWTFWGGLTWWSVRGSNP